MKGVLKDKKVTGKRLIKSSASVFTNEEDERYLTQHILHNVRTAAGTWRAYTRPAKPPSPVGQVALIWEPWRSQKDHCWYNSRVHTKEYCWAHTYPTGNSQQSFCKGKYCPATYHVFRRCRGKQVNKLRPCRPGFSESLWQSFPPKNTEEILLELNWEKGHVVNWKLSQGKI